MAKASESLSHSDEAPDHLAYSQPHIRVTASSVAAMCNVRFHRSFFLGPNASLGRPAPVRVSFADLDHRGSKTGDGPTIFFIGGAGACRWNVMRFFDALSAAYRVRTIVVDNFGMGGTGRVPLGHRAASYVELVSQLLEHLRVKHVALCSHSAGCVYLFNVLLSLQHILHPLKPFLWIAAPWILPKHSRSLGPLSAQYIPRIILQHSFVVSDYLDKKVGDGLYLLHRHYKARKKRKARAKPQEQSPCVREVVVSRKEKDARHQDDGQTHEANAITETNVASPPRGSNNEVCGRTRSSISHQDIPASPDFDEPLAIVPSHVESMPSQSVHASSIAFQAHEGALEIEPSVAAPVPSSTADSEDMPPLHLEPWSNFLANQWRRAEDTKGTSDEMLFCLQRGGASWGRFRDLDEAVAQLSNQERARLRQQTDGPRLRVDVAFAGKDRLVGKDGSKFFCALWEGQEDWADIEAWTDQDSGHNAILGFGGNFEYFMGEVARSWWPINED